MIPEEKAKWLIEKHEEVYQHYPIAVDHAIVTVETILIKTLDNNLFALEVQQMLHCVEEYWKEVLNFLKQL